MLSQPQDGAIAATVYVIEQMGNETFVFLTAGSNRLIARASAEFRADEDSQVWIRMMKEKMHFFDPVSGERRATDKTD